MKSYRGIIRIECNKPKGIRCPLDLKRDCKAHCAQCPHAVTAIVNLSGEEICRLQHRNGRPPKPKADLKPPEATE